MAMPLHKIPLLRRLIKTIVYRHQWMLRKENDLWVSAVMVEVIMDLAVGGALLSSLLFFYCSAAAIITTTAKALLPAVKD